MNEITITKEYLRANPSHIFVFGDNCFRTGHGGAAKLRHEPNVYGFITKRSPDYLDASFFRPEDYRPFFDEEMRRLVLAINERPNWIFLISRLGGGLANRFGIFEKIIQPQIGYLARFPNVKFLFELGDVAKDEWHSPVP